ncbi:MAG: immune inhibitor A, partial [Bacteroidaceae bacterium]|nr:immune inhibitor A [Bacteroidaceae bacterium]
RPIAANDSVITDWQADGIGVVVHEISHAIGLPDLYDTNYKAFGMDFWSIMDYGMYTRQSKYPVGYTAYEREFMGWQQTETITEPTTLRLSCFHQGGKGYKIVNEANSNEYYILDNRQALGWDWGVCSNRGHGMLVMHVDYNKSSWTSNNVNTTYNHQRFTIIPANNSLIGSNNAKTGAQWKESLLGNPFPGITENHALTDETVPASTVYAGEFMHKPLMDIQETEDGIVTLKVMPLGTLEAPADTWFEDVKPGSTLVVWEPVENAELYNLQLWSEGELVFHQDSIAQTSFRLSDLPTDVNYTFAVQAISDSYLNSEWTESESFRADPDVISEITESMELVRIYEMNGRLVCECFADELYRLSLQRGIYIVRYYDGRTKKVMI